MARAGRALAQCSCSIDVIASILPYDRYVSAETVLSLSQAPGHVPVAGTICGARKPKPASAASSACSAEGDRQRPCAPILSQRKALLDSSFCCFRSGGWPAACEHVVGGIDRFGAQRA